MYPASIIALNKPRTVYSTVHRISTCLSPSFHSDLQLQQVLSLLMSCLGKILAGVVSRCLPTVYDSQYPSPMIVVLLFYSRGISTPCQTNSINVPVLKDKNNKNRNNFKFYPNLQTILTNFNKYFKISTGLRVVNIIKLLTTLLISLCGLFNHIELNGSRRCVRASSAFLTIFHVVVTLTFDLSILVYAQLGTHP